MTHDDDFTLAKVDTRLYNKGLTTCGSVKTSAKFLLTDSEVLLGKSIIVALSLTNPVVLGATWNEDNTDFDTDSSIPQIRAWSAVNHVFGAVWKQFPRLSATTYTPSPATLVNPYRQGKAPKPTRANLKQQTLAVSTFKYTAKLHVVGPTQDFQGKEDPMNIPFRPLRTAIYQAERSCQILPIDLQLSDPQNLREEVADTIKTPVLVVNSPNSHLPIKNFEIKKYMI